MLDPRFGCKLRERVLVERNVLAADIDRTRATVPLQRFAGHDGIARAVRYVGEAHLGILEK